MSRRHSRARALLAAAPLVLAGVALCGVLVTTAADVRMEADLLIVGGTESGCAAAIQAARMGVRSIVLVNDIDWLGGQFSAAGLAAIDENRGPEGYGHGLPFPRAGLFREVVERLEKRNLERYGHARPGNTRVITTCRPADAEQVFRQLLAVHVASGRIRVLSPYSAVGAEHALGGQRLAAVRLRCCRDGEPGLTVSAGLTIDASDWGDVIKVSGAAYEFGPDLRETYGEPLAPRSREGYPLTDMNPITYCMVVIDTGGSDPIYRPGGYDPRNYRGHAYPHAPSFLYTSRRLVDHSICSKAGIADVLLLCFPAFDYPLDVLPAHVVAQLEATEAGASRKNIVQMTGAQRQIIFDDAKRYSLGFLHHVQTEVDAGMKDRTHSLRRFELTDEFGTPDRLPPRPYVRESLRLKAMYMMRQQDTTGHGGRPGDFSTVMYHDGVACWQFEYDFHPTGRRFLDADAKGPWQNYFRKGRTWGPPYSGRCLFSLRSLVPEKVDGLLGAQKNLGYSSLVGSAVRLHDQSMAVGQAAGAVAAVSIRRGVQPRKIPLDRALLGEVWRGLCSRRGGAVPCMLWPFGDVDPDHRAFEAMNLLAIHRDLPLTPGEVDFQPDEPATHAWRSAVVARSLATRLFDTPPSPPGGELTRGEFALEWWSRIAGLPERPLPRRTDGDGDGDMDGDGIPDGEDPLPFDSRGSSWPEFVPPADEDGHPDPVEVSAGPVRLFNFVGRGVAPVEGFTAEHGDPFEPGRGFGWQRDLGSRHRRRGLLEGVWRDTFLFTRGHDRWEYAVPEGRYRVTVCVGDAGFVQRGQNVTVEGRAVLRDLTTAIGQFVERTVEVDVADGRLTIDIGRDGAATNTCLNWIRVITIRPADARPTRDAPFIRSTVEGWRVHVDSSLLDDHPRDLARALDELENQLFQVTLVVPSEALRELRGVPIWLRDDDSQGDIAFHPDRAWLVERGHQSPPEESMVELGARKLVLETRRQPWLVFHELTHGYDWCVLGDRRGYGSRGGACGYQRAMESGRYDRALHQDGRYRRPYHTTSSAEFFAETSEAYFGTNDIFPFVRAELEAHDPETARLIERAWHVDAGECAARRREALRMLADFPVDARAGPAADATYARHDVEGWDVRVHPDLAVRDAAAARILRLLRRDLHTISGRLAGAATGGLQRTRLWVENDSPFVPWVACHVTDGRPAVDAGSLRRAGDIAIGSAGRYERLSDLQPSILLNLFARVRYLDESGPGRREIEREFARVVRSGLHDDVLRFDGERVRHPALASPVAFFAEMTEAALGTNDHFPFVRAELRERDPGTADLIDRVWKASTP